MTKVIITNADGSHFLTLLTSAHKAASMIIRAPLAGLHASLGTIEPGDRRRFPTV